MGGHFLVKIQSNGPNHETQTLVMGTSIFFSGMLLCTKIHILMLKPWMRIRWRHTFSFICWGTAMTTSKRGHNEHKPHALIPARVALPPGTNGKVARLNSPSSSTSETFSERFADI